MRQLESEGRRHESRVPLAWDLQKSINAELAEEGSELLAEFYVTNEMAQQLRQIWMTCMHPQHPQHPQRRWAGDVAARV
jgi:hypothetical protein